MPFQSEKQRRYLWANEPEIAREWTDRYGASRGGITRLPFIAGSDPYSIIHGGYFPDDQEGIETVDIDEMASNAYKNYGHFFRNQPVDEERNFLQKAIAGQTQNFDNLYSGLEEKGSGIVDFLMDKGTGLRQGLSVANENYLMPALAGIGTIANRYNPLKEGSQNYNPDLQGQVDILDEWGMLGDQSSPYKITSGPLAGKNLVSGFGTNDYRKMLQKRIDYFRNKKSLTESQNEKMHEAIAEEKRILEKKTRAAAAAAASQRRAGRGGDHMSRSRDQGGLGISRSQAQAVSDANRDAGMSGWGL